MASSALEPQSADLQRLLDSKDELTPTLFTHTFIIGLLILVVTIVIWRSRAAVKANPTPDGPPKVTSRPEDVHRLNGSVWELHKPPDGDHKMDIIFFHGCQMHNDEEAFWRTWLSRDETIVWPKVWLAREFPGARILSISYDSSIRRAPGQMDMYLVIENLITDIIWSSTCKAGQNCPVIFAGHCFGGMVIKAFLLRCDEVASRNRSASNEEKKKVQELKTFLQNCKGIFYYSPSSGGASLLSRVYLDFIFANMNQRLVDFLKILSPQSSRINEEFRRLQDKFEPRLTTNTIGAQKTWKTKLWEFVVPEGSARQYADSNIYWVDADHFAASRAKDNSTCMIFTGLRDLVANHNIVSSSIPTNRDDTGEEIAREIANKHKLGLNFAQLKAANPGVNWNELKVGQVLKIPASGSRNSTTVTTYTVVSGDTGEDVAKKLGITFRQLEADNPNVIWNALTLGQVLKVRGITFVQLEASNPDMNWHDLQIGQVLKVRDLDSYSSTRTYNVVSGDTGQKIAKKFRMTFPELEALNWKPRVPLNTPENLPA